MAEQNLPSITDPIIDLDHINDVRSSLNGAFIGRNSLGASASGQDIGSLAIPWGTLYGQNVNINGKVIDFDLIGSSNSNNSIVSSATRSGSNQPDFLRAAGSGSGASFDVLGATTSLVYTANGSSATVSTDVTISALTVAPSSNNTCLINDSSYADGNSTKYEGEGTGAITIDTAGSEITDRIGQYVALKGANEIMIAFVESATTLRNCFRGFFFDESGDPIVRETLANNDTLTLMSLGWVFGESNGTTFDISYRSPYIQHTEPSSGVTDDYWFDMSNNFWRRYNGSNWIEINRTLLGQCVIDGTDCIATRSLDFTKSFDDFIDLEVALESTTKIRSAKAHSSVSVYGTTKEWLGAPVVWDISADLESGLTETSDTLYYLYVTENGETIISDERPYNRRADLKGFYHPYHTWRFIGVCYNDGSSDFTSANSKNNDQPRVDIFNASDEYLPLPNIDSVKVTVTGSGGGDGNGSNGSASSFGSIMTANGGLKGEAEAIGSNTSYGGCSGGSGGTATGGDINISGQDGGGTGMKTTGGSPEDINAGAGGVSASGAGRGSDGSGSGENAIGAGGGGGTAIKWISNLSSRVSVTVGTTNDDGIVVVEY